MDVFAIVNPLSGAGANPDAAAQRTALLMRHFVEAGITGGVHLTERRGHATELAAGAIAQGARVVLAWGGDGTINEIASAVAGTPASLAIVPAGSGNGFARDLAIPLDPPSAIDVAIRGRDRAIDAGEIDGRLFFNIAGIGVDAEIAEQFNTRGRLGRRGLGGYVRIGLRECFRYRARHYRVTLDGELIATDALVIAFANGREYGNRIRLAPQARMDDGKLEAIIADDRPPVSRLLAVRHLAVGTADRAPRVTRRSVTSAVVETDGEILYHVDGEIGRARDRVEVRIRPRALKVRVPVVR
ncbi:MAG TPA: diacylglycerol kinase family protein [Vicinamibacterales bacterium]